MALKASTDVVLTSTKLDRVHKNLREIQTYLRVNKPPVDYNEQPSGVHERYKNDAMYNSITAAISVVNSLRFDPELHD